MAATINNRLGATEPVEGPGLAEIDKHLAAIRGLLQPMAGHGRAQAAAAMTGLNDFRQLCLVASDNRPYHEKWTALTKPRSPLSVVE